MHCTKSPSSCGFIYFSQWPCETGIIFYKLYPPTTCLLWLEGEDNFKIEKGKEEKGNRQQQIETCEPREHLITVSP